MMKKKQIPDVVNTNAFALGNGHSTTSEIRASQSSERDSMEKTDTNGLEPRDAKYKNSIITIPNLICFGRAIGSIGLIWIALKGWPYWFAGVYAVLNLSDFVDGKLARWLKQRSDFGARLDSFADSTLYGALIAGALILSWNMLQHELAWLIVGVISYVATSSYGLIKFGRIPSYHTFGAKKTQWLALIAGVSLILEWSAWPMRICVIALVLTNIEAMAITHVLKEWRADVLTLFHVWPKDRTVNSNATPENETEGE